MVAVRRGASLLALLGVMSALLETVIPDLHDRDVPTELAAALDASLPADDVAAGFPHDGPSPTHAALGDHCAHSHVLDAVAKPCYARAKSPATIPAIPRLLYPTSISLSPDQRPPIA